MHRLRRQICWTSLAKVGARLRAAGLMLAILLTLLSGGRVWGQLFLGPATGSAEPALVDNLDGKAPRLQPLLAGTGFSIGQRSIDRRSHQHGSGAERTVLSGPAGRMAPLFYAIPPAPVIKELSIRADVATNRAGMQLAVRVVLPRSIDQTTGRPFELLVRSDQLGRARAWQELVLENIPQLLADSARVARVQHGFSIDEREAFVSQVVFLVPGGTGASELLVDRIRVFGILNQQPASALAVNTKSAKKITNASGSTTVPESTLALPRQPTPMATTTNQEDFAARYARVPRIVEWQGEPFKQLKQLGFNTISMSRLPNQDELHQIEMLGLSLFCPPPTQQQLSKTGITAKWNSVLAWNLGEQLSAQDLDYVEHWEQAVSRSDTIDARPTVLAPELYTLNASRIADVMLVGRAVVGRKQSIREHTAWLVQRQRLARPGTPLWTTIETQPNLHQQQQTQALSVSKASSLDTSYAQLTALTSASLGIKTRGYLFHSQASLATNDALTKRRALVLELMNYRLQLIEPWVAAGNKLSAARSTQPELSALVMQAERSHLLAPVWWSHDMQATVHPRQGGPVSFIVPGVAESTEAYLLTLGGIQRVSHQRVTGGIRVSLDALPYDSFLLLSDDLRAVSRITGYLRRIAPRATKLRRDLVQFRFQQARQLLATMPSLASEASPTQLLLAAAQKELTACDREFSARHFYLAYLHADAADLATDQLLAELQSQANPSRSPRPTALEQGSLALADRLHLQHTLARSPLSANLLAGGGFESLSGLLQNGWRHKQLSIDGVKTAVRLSPMLPHSGSYCLELEARSIDEQAPVTIVPTSPVWISSAPQQVKAGDLVEITGVARLPGPLHGSVDGLQIIDSIGGPDMALRIHDATTWKPFRLIRAVTSDTQVTVTIALSGIGKAQVDDLAIRVVKRR